MRVTDKEIRGMLARFILVPNRTVMVRLLIEELETREKEQSEILRQTAISQLDSGKIATDIGEVCAEIGA